jgi:hypothetical protein
VDRVGVLVGDLDAELLLDGHDDLDGIEAVETEVIGEVGGGLDLINGVSLRFGDMSRRYVRWRCR